MASAHDIFCGICDKLQTTKHAVKWCPECDEGLCAECEKYHFVSKSSCHHAVISIEDFKALPTNISKIEHYCEEHQREFKNYCPQHDKLCCPLCISKFHNKCTGLLALEDIVKDAKTSTLLCNIEQSLHDTKINIEKIIKDREQNLARIKEQRQKIHDEIKQTRQKIDAYLDEMEKKTLEELDAVEKSLQFEIDSLLSQLKERYNVVEDLQKTIASVKSYASDLQAFYGTKQLESQVDQENKYVMSFVDDGSLKQINLKCDVNKQIAEILIIPVFAPITVEKGKTTVGLHTEKDKEAQITSIVPKSHQDITSIALNFLRKFDIPKGQDEHCVTSSAIMPNGNLVIADCDYNNRLIIVNDHGVLQREFFVMPSMPFDVTCRDDDSIAFSSWVETKVDTLNTESEVITNSITTTGIIDGITHRQGTIIYCERENGIQQQQIDSKSSQTIVKQSLPDMTYVTTDGTNLYHTNNETHTVTCYNMTGENIWEYKDESILECPYGVAVDKHSNVYISSQGNKSIVLVSSDGKNGRQLLKDDTLIDIRGLAIDREKGKLFVTCYSGKVLLYEISFA